jgi:hypothetical protein
MKIEASEDVAPRHIVAEEWAGGKLRKAAFAPNFPVKESAFRHHNVAAPFNDRRKSFLRVVQPHVY